jgi:hypothetical protein
MKTYRSPRWADAFNGYIVPVTLAHVGLGVGGDSLDDGKP